MFGKGAVGEATHGLELQKDGSHIHIRWELINHRSVDTWNPIISKIKRKLNGWQHKLLSFGGRICLILSMISSISIYFMSFFRVPKKVVLVLESLFRNFLWGGEGERKRLA